MRSATLLAFVDWRPSAVKRTILVSAAGCGLALEPPLGASLGDGSEAALCRSHASTARARAALPAPRQALCVQRRLGQPLVGRFRPSVGQPFARCAWLRAVTNTCFGRIRGINHSDIVRVLAWLGRALIARCAAYLAALVHLVASFEAEKYALDVANTALQSAPCTRRSACPGS